jgi:putative phage-type endonuclease
MNDTCIYAWNNGSSVCTDVPAPGSMMCEQHDKTTQRRKSLGGSDAAAAVNLSPWCSPYKLWLEKRGDREPDDLSDKDFIHFGNVLEDIVAQEFSRRTDLRVARVNRQLSHPDHPWMTAHIDRRIVGVREGLECKTASVWNADEWGDRDDQVPLHYLIQVMHYMSVTGWDAWHVAVLIGGNDFRRFRIARDEEFIEDLIKREKEFWDRVISGEPPDVVSLDDSFMRWPKDYGNPIVASPNARRAYDRWMKLREEADAIEDKMKAEKLIIQQWMGDHATLLDVDGRTRLCTWKAQKTKRVSPDKLREKYPDIAAECSYETDSRVMRVVEKK